MSIPKHILIIDDDSFFRLMLETFLKKNNFKTSSAASASEAMKLLSQEKFDLILIDFRLPDKDGLELLKDIKKEQLNTPLILMTSFVNIRTAVRAIKSGAFEYITKPINTDELMAAIQMALKNADTKTEKNAEKSFHYIEGISANSRDIVKNIKLVSPTNLSVLVTGESGTGKEYVARMIHSESKRSKQPFVAIDCGVLTSELAASELFGHLKGSYTGASTDKAGYFETANGGTIFLDEIGNLSLDVQMMLLRAIQEKQVRRVGATKTNAIDVRIIAATNENLKVATSKGTFREDLYHRLNEFSIYVPPLRDRKEDLPYFVNNFVEQANIELEKSVLGLDKKAEELIISYNWQGNLRELKNIIKRSVLLTPDNNKITPDVLPQELLIHIESNSEGLSDFDIKAANFKQEKDYIITVLEKVKYNKSSAARILNIDRKTLYNKLKQYGIEN